MERQLLAEVSRPSLYLEDLLRMEEEVRLCCPGFGGTIGIWYPNGNKSPYQAALDGTDLINSMFTNITSGMFRWFYMKKGDSRHPLHTWECGNLIRDSLGHMACPDCRRMGTLKRYLTTVASYLEMKIRDERERIRTYRKESLSDLTLYGNIEVRKKIGIMFEEVVEALVRLFPQDKARDYYVYLVRETECVAHLSIKYAEENFGTKTSERRA